MPIATLDGPGVKPFSSVFDESLSMSEPQGVEGREVQRNARLADAHWKSRPSREFEAEPAFSYESVPLKTVGKIRVKYRLIGPLPPIPYSHDQ